MGLIVGRCLIYVGILVILQHNERPKDDNDLYGIDLVFP